MDKLIGRIVKYGTTFFEIKEILPPLPDHPDLGERLRVRDLETGEDSENFLASVHDGSWLLVPATFPRDRLDKLRAYYRAMPEAHEIEMDLLTWEDTATPAN